MHRSFYANITNPKDRLRLLIEAHHLQVLPVNRCIKSFKDLIIVHTGTVKMC